jgi:hypothetical protein
MKKLFTLLLLSGIILISGCAKNTYDLALFKRNNKNVVLNTTTTVPTMKDVVLKIIDDYEETQSLISYGGSVSKSLPEFLKICKKYGIYNDLIVSYNKLSTDEVTFRWLNVPRSNVKCYSYFIFKEQFCEAQSNVFIGPNNKVLYYESWSYDQDISSLNSSKIVYRYNGLISSEIKPYIKLTSL